MDSAYPYPHDRWGRFAHWAGVGICAVSHACVIACNIAWWFLYAFARSVFLHCSVVAPLGRGDSAAHKSTHTAARRRAESHACAQKGQKKRLSSYINRFNLVLFVFWVALGALGLLILTMEQPASQHFDPFEILGVEKEADEKAITKVYRELSRKWHPDKNPAPEAPAVFDKITKAKNALLDPAARENWEKHGHPDGPQARRPLRISAASPAAVTAAALRASLLPTHCLRRLQARP
jgi:DnaJ domain